MLRNLHEPQTSGVQTLSDAVACLAAQDGVGRAALHTRLAQLQPKEVTFSENVFPAKKKKKKKR